MSVGLAGGFVTAGLRASGVDGEVATVALATSEVVTNAVVHASGDISIRLWVTDDVVRVEVTEGAESLPVACRAAPDATSGRGVQIVEALTDAWGAEAIPGVGKMVWFTIGAPRGSLPSPVARRLSAEQGARPGYR